MALDVEVTEDLRQEGLQGLSIVFRTSENQRFRAYRRIDIFLEDSAWLKEVMDLHKSYIFAEILADTYIGV